MKTRATDVLAKVPGVEMAHLGGELVLLDAAGKHLRGLNPTAARVWELLDGTRDVAGVAAVLAGEYGAGQGRVLGDVLELCGELQRRQLIASIGAVP